MGIRIEKKIVALESMTCCAIEPCYLGITEGEVIEYEKEHPFPKDDDYLFSDLLQDLHSEGTWCFPSGIKEETVEWIEEMLNKLV